MNKNEQELNDAFVDVRRAYRLIAQLQSRLRDIAFYIKNRTQFSEQDCAGNKLYSKSISSSKRSMLDLYASLKVSPNMWSWDFMYGYAFEFYLANTKIGDKICAMSIIILCDDGFYISKDQKKSKTSIRTYASEEESNSWIILAYGDGASSDCWMGGYDTNVFLETFMNRKGHVYKKEVSGNVFVAKKYLMQQFFNQETTDNNLKDFAKIVFEEADTNILNENSIQ